MGVALALLALGGTSGCGRHSPDPAEPGRGPGALVGNGEPVFSGGYAAGDEALPAVAPRTPPAPNAPVVCDLECRAHCDGAQLAHPVHRAACGRLWGVGLAPKAISQVEACRRLWADMAGRFPDPKELSRCVEEPWSKTVQERLDSPEFVELAQRRFADLFLYNHRAVNIERIFDLDLLVAKTYRGLVSWDQFAAVVSAHPAFVRRYDSGPDRVDALFRLFLGRPPSSPEQVDLSRSYRVWENGYIDHAFLGRVPDAVISFPCVAQNGQPDPAKAGMCTSSRWGEHEVIIVKDRRAARKDDEPEGAMWSGYLRSEEWERLQTPGKIVASMPEFWERAAEMVLSVYFGDRHSGGPYYDVATEIPGLRSALARYLVDHNADIRSLHFAVATSVLYRQSAKADQSSAFPWTYGPLKQIDAEGWLASVAGPQREGLLPCDRRISFPDDFLTAEGANGWTRTLVRHSQWKVDEKGRARMRDANLLRNLGGCPTRESGPSFRAVSIVNAALQEGFVREICAGKEEGLHFSRDWLLGSGGQERAALSESRARAILETQSLHFLGRAATDEDWQELLPHAKSCMARRCTELQFAQPLCFALLTGAEVLFY